MSAISGSEAKSGHGIRAVIFDMDGLMLDTERLAQRAWQDAARDWAYELPDHVFLAAVGRTAADTGAIFAEDYGEGFPFEEMYARKQELLHAMIESEGIPTMPGLFEVLKTVDDLGLQKAVATSTARPLAEVKLAKANLRTRFDVVVCGNEIARGKPAPDIFLAAARELQLPPAQCVVLEDSEAGIQAAHAADMIPIWIPDLKEPTPETGALAHATVTSLHEVPALLKLLL